MAIIYLFRQLPGGLNLPTLYLGRAALRRYYTWHFSMQGLPASDITVKSRGLLPHIFTLIPAFQPGQLFSVALSLPAFYYRCLAYHKVHCSVLSGLSSPSCEEAITRLVAA